MKTPSLSLAAAALFTFGVDCPGAGVPKSLDVAPCQAAPNIDGVIAPEEWKGATSVKFDMAMIRLSPAMTEKRAAELRVMNSANGLYIAFRIEDKTVDESLSPLVFDAAVLAFARGPELREGDDRKVIAAKIYKDKHIGPGGKGEADDARQDGLGAMSRADGICSFEWAIPLDSGDGDDIRSRPGDSIRFNLAYFDAFQLPLTKTIGGGVHGVQIDRAGAWGTLRLASDVRDDGGALFQGPAWVKPLFQTLGDVPASRLRLTDVTAVPGGSQAVKALVSFTYRDERGADREAKAKLYLPASVRAKGAARAPLYFAAGYEIADGMEAVFANLGWVVASPRALPVNPLIRGANPDIALMHMVRSLPFVDDTRVMIGGGSAGGYMTLMLSAETFPLAGANPDLPPVNWGYNAAYFFKQLDMITPRAGAASKVPALFTVSTMLASAKDVYDADFEDPTWFAHSPVAHVPTVTCPVLVYWSTADVLVPMNQVGGRWVQPFDKSKFPDRFTMDPAALVKGREGRMTFIEALSPRDYEVFTIDAKATPAPGAPAAREMPVSSDKPWSIVILDEGSPEPGLGHRKTNVHLGREEFLRRIMTGKIAARQLTAPKLERLMDRYAGKEWLPSRLKHLDLPESERRDVLRGLSTYVAAGAENAATFAKLYAQLPLARRVLAPPVVERLTQGKPAR